MPPKEFKIIHKRKNKLYNHSSMKKIIIKTKASALLALFCSGILLAADWPAFRGNQQRTGYYSDPVGIPSQKPLWTDSLRCSFVSSPSVVNGTLYIGGRDSCVYAIDAGNGSVVWKTKTNGWVDASPLIRDGMVIVGSRDGTVYAFDSRTGNVISFLNAGLQLSSVAMTPDGTILSGLGPPFNGFSAYVFLKAKWDKVQPSWSIPFDQITYSSPALSGSRAVIGSSNGRLYGIDIAAKDTSWSIQTKGGVYLSTPAIDTSTVYFAPGNSDYNIYAVGLSDGAFFWKSDGTPKYNLPKKAVQDNMISPRQFRELLRLSPQDRVAAIANMQKQGLNVPDILLNSVHLDKKAALAAGNSFYSYGEIKTSSVAVGQDNVYVIQKELGYPTPRFTLLAIDKYQGTETWRFSDMRSCVQIGYSSSPVATKSTIFFGWGEGRIYGLSAKTGEKIWSDSLHGDIISSPAIANEKLYVATMDGYLYAYNLTATAPGLDFQTSTYCYPNPARGSVSHIQLFVAKAGTVELTLYNSAEKPVFRFSRHLSANEKYAYDWNLSGVANGVYFALVKVKYDDGTSDKKVLKAAVLR
jgi:outer membrane protein assembly factor BamB